MSMTGLKPFLTLDVLACPGNANLLLNRVDSSNGMLGVCVHHTANHVHIVNLLSMVSLQLAVPMCRKRLHL